MRDPFSSDKRKRRKIRLLDVDAWFDSTLSDAGHDLTQFYEGLIVFFRRFRLRGIGRWTNEIFCEGLTLGVAGGLVALAFAVPAFEVIRSDWRAQQDYSITFLDRHGNEIGKRGILQTDIVELEALPDHLIKAVLATEDRRFFHHFGIDVFGLVRAMVENARAGEIVQGGSSVTQQLAKNLFLNNERTLERKIKEAYLSLWLEANLPKREILKLYFDRSYMGGGTFGIVAASEFYFGKSPRDLTLSESAMLAGLFKAPARFAPHINLPAARARANEVLTNLVQAGYMSEGQVVGARRNPSSVVPRETKGSPDYFLDWAFEEVKRLVPGRDRVLTVRTSIDTHLQRIAEAAVETSLRESGEAYNVSQAALVAMEPDGRVRAMVGGRDYGQSTFNRAVNALRQPGSSFKPFTYAAALEDGYTPESVVVDGPVSIGNWSPQNYNRSYSGRITLRNALTRSINVVPVKLSIAMGRQPIAEMAERLGIINPVRVTRSLALGTSEVTVLGMARAYSSFANGGFRADPHAIISITTADGETIYDRDTEQVELPRVLEHETVAGMIDMLHSVVENGTGRRARLPGVIAAGKTGTTQAYRDAWFVGFTGNYTTAVWFGNDNFTATRRLTGGRLPAETWQKFMRAAHVSIPLKPLQGFEGQQPESLSPEVVAEADADDLFGQPRSDRLSRSSAEALSALSDRFRQAASGPMQAASAAAPRPTF